MPRKYMCPHCGSIEWTNNRLIKPHDAPDGTGQPCPGSQQNPRDQHADARLLWNGQPNPHLAARAR